VKVKSKNSKSKSKSIFHPNIRTQPYDPDLDHDWFEFESVDETEEESTEVIDLAEFPGKVKENPLRDI